MKFIGTALLAGSASAQWGVWMPDKTCDSTQIRLDTLDSTEVDGSTPEELQMACQNWCETSTNTYAS